jgi:uncharacterized protein (TIGR04255 family)
MSTVGGIPLAPRFILERDPLAQVISQVRFSPVLRLRQRDALVPFQESVRGDYPRYVEQQGMSLIITPAGVTQQANPDPLHRFEDSAGTFAAVLSQDFVALEARDFSGIDDFAPRVAQLAEAVAEHYQPAEMTRIGLRFINELRLPSQEPEVEMASAIAPPVLGIAGTAELMGAIDSAQQVVEVRGEGNRLVVRHGFVRTGGTTVDRVQGEVPTAELGQPFYLLDIDVFAEETLPFSPEGVDTRLRRFNDDARSLFAWAVSEEYRRSALGQKDLDS